MKYIQLIAIIVCLNSAPSSYALGTNDPKYNAPSTTKIVDQVMYEDFASRKGYYSWPLIILVGVSGLVLLYKERKTIIEKVGCWWGPHMQQDSTMQTVEQKSGEELGEVQPRDDSLL